jgi:hypothetical protein
MHFDPQQWQGSVDQQPYDWLEFRRRARLRLDTAARRRANLRRYAAVAAAFVLVVVGLDAWIRGSERLVLYAPPLTEARVDEAERWLVSLPNDPIVVRVGTRAAVVGLEDRIAQLDDVLSEARVEGTQPAKLTELEEQRARLVNSLAQVRYAETLASASR